MYRDSIYSLDSYDFDEVYDSILEEDDYSYESYYDYDDLFDDDYDDYAVESIAGIKNKLGNAKTVIHNVKIKIKKMIRNAIQWLKDKIGNLTAKVSALFSKDKSATDIINNRAAIEYVKRVGEYNKILTREFGNLRNAKKFQEIKKLTVKSKDKLDPISERVDTIKEKAKQGSNIYSAKTANTLIKQLKTIEADLNGLEASVEGVFDAMGASYDRSIDNRAKFRGEGKREQWREDTKAERDSAISGATSLIRGHVSRLLDHVVTATSIVNGGIKVKKKKADETWIMGDDFGLDIIW